MHSLIERAQNAKLETVLAVDPGEDSGWAHFSRGVLKDVWFRTPQHAVQVPVDLLVIEFPRYYPAGRCHVDPNDLLRLAEKVGIVQGTVPHKALLKPFPKDWKGSVPKDICETRILKEMTEHELALLDFHLEAVPKSYRHNVIDAVGIGLWAVGRFGR